MNEKAVVSPFPISFRIGKVLFESRHDLLEGLLIQGSSCKVRIEMNLVDTLGEQSGEPPIRDYICDFSNEVLSFFQRQVDVRTCMGEILLDLLIRFGLFCLLKAQQVNITFSFDRRPARIPIELLKICNARLFQVRAQNPSRVKFFTAQCVTVKHGRNIMVG